MKICILATHYLPHIGGLELVTSHMAHEFLKSGHEVHIITPQNTLQPEASSEIFLHRIPIPGYPEGNTICVFLKGLLFFIKSYLCIRKIHPDIVHVQNLTNSVPAYFAKKILHIPYCIGIHANFELLGPFLPKMFSKLWKYLPYIRQADIIFAPTKKISDDVREKFHKIPVLIPNGIDSQYFYLSSERMHHSDLTEILCVSRLDQLKGLDYAITAMHTVVAKHSDIHLTIIGDGNEKEALDTLVEKYHLQSNVTLTGALSSEEIGNIMRSSSLYLFPSLSEAFGITLLEAMACGLPIISTAVGIAPELIATYQNGILVPRKSSETISESIVLLKEKPDVLTQYRECSRNYAKEYRWDSICGQYINIYETIITHIQTT